MFLGYNTNGFAHHRLEDAIEILAEVGYEGVAITLDYHSLNPFDPTMPEQRDRVKSLLQKYRLRSVIETGSRFLLNPRKKHSPTLVDRFEDAEHRAVFLRHSIDLAAELNSDAVSFWSGSAADSSDVATQIQRLVSSLAPLCQYAQSQGVRLAFEPEPGMVIDTMDRFAKLKQKLAAFDTFGLTLDVGHLHCNGEFPIRDHIVNWKDWLWNIHIEDMKQGVHDHLMFGEGEMDFAAIFRTFREIDYRGGVFVELSRHSHNAVETAKKSLSFLKSHLD